MRLRNSLISTAFIGLLALAPVSVFGSVVVAEHRGALDPLDEFNWTLNGAATTGVASSTLEAWNLNTNSLGGTARANYRNFNIDAGDIDEGWVARIILRVEDLLPEPDTSLSVRVDNGSLFWLTFGLDAQGNTLVNALNSSQGTHTVTEPGLLGEGYHLYELLDGPNDVAGDGAADGSASLYIDGVLVETGYSGFNAATTVRVFFGDISATNGENSNASYNLVSLETGGDVDLLPPIPEPTSIALVTMGSLMMLAGRKKRRIVK